MKTDFTPTLKRVLRELQALRARIDRQISVMQRVIGPSAGRRIRAQRSTKTVRPSALVGYARDRAALLKHKRLRKPR
jgi:hypothetical protein